jgi:hypothetical protein
MSSNITLVNPVLGNSGNSISQSLLSFNKQALATYCYVSTFNIANPRNPYKFASQTDRLNARIGETLVYNNQQ